MFSWQRRLSSYVSLFPQRARRVFTPCESCLRKKMSRAYYLSMPAMLLIPLTARQPSTTCIECALHWQLCSRTHTGSQYAYLSPGAVRFCQWRGRAKVIPLRWRYTPCPSCPSSSNSRTRIPPSHKAGMQMMMRLQEQSMRWLIIGLTYKVEGADSAIIQTQRKQCSS